MNGERWKIAGAVVLGLFLGWLLFIRQKKTAQTIGAGGAAAQVSLGETFDVNGLVHATPLDLQGAEVIPQNTNPCAPGQTMYYVGKTIWPCPGGAGG